MQGERFRAHSRSRASASGSRGPSRTPSQGKSRAVSYQHHEEGIGELDPLFTSDDKDLWVGKQKQNQELQTSAPRDLIEWMCLISWFVQGTAVISMETSISFLAEELSINVSLVSSALVFRACGSAVGSISSGFLIRQLGAHSLLLASCIFMGGFILLLPYAQNLPSVWLLYFGIAAFVCMQTSAASVLPRQLHPEADQMAGKLFQMFMVANGIGINAVPFCELFLSFKWVLLGFGVAAIVFGCTGHYYLVRSPAVVKLSSPETIIEEEDESQEDNFYLLRSCKKVLGKLRGSVNRFDFAVAIMQLLLNNIIIQTDSFLRTYLQSLGLEQISSGLLTAFLAGALIMQSFFAFYTVTLKQLYFLMASAFVLAPTSLMVLVFVSGSAVFGYALWFVFVVVGMCLGPSFGWCYDLWNRITYSSEDGAALISLFSYLTSWLSFVMFQIYDLTGDKNLLLYFNSAEFCMALLLLAAVKLARNS